MPTQTPRPRDDDNDAHPRFPGARSRLLLAPALLARTGHRTLAARPIPLDEAVELAQRNGLAAVQARGQDANAGRACARARRAVPEPQLHHGAGEPVRAIDSTTRAGSCRISRRSRGATAPGFSANSTVFDGGAGSARSVARGRTSAPPRPTRSPAVQPRAPGRQQYYSILAARESEAAARAARAGGGDLKRGDRPHRGRRRDRFDSAASSPSATRSSR